MNRRSLLKGLALAPFLRKLLFEDSPVGAAEPEIDPCPLGPCPCPPVEDVEISAVYKCVTLDSTSDSVSGWAVGPNWNDWRVGDELSIGWTQDERGLWRPDQVDRVQR